MKLVVGLGNPGKEYKNTRHNIGFMILDNYLGKVLFKKRFDAEYYINEDDILFVKPQTYMNLSGISIIKFINYYKININDILIIQDDLDLKVGSYKIKRNSSSGGHNGIKSIIKELDSNEFARLKVGIGKSKLIPTDKYVLSKIPTSELKLIKNNYDIFNDIIDEFINNNIDSCMLKYNSNKE